MKHLRSTRHLIKMWHRREKATIDHLVQGIAGAAEADAPNAHSPFTTSGLAVEAQIRKAWPQNQGGLPIF